MKDAKCGRCKQDATPATIGGMDVKPCGLLGKEEYFMAVGVDIVGCPMNAWQDGYLACLKKELEPRDK